MAFDALPRGRRLDGPRLDPLRHRRDRGAREEDRDRETAHLAARAPIVVPAHRRPDAAAADRPSAGDAGRGPRPRAGDGIASTPPPPRCHRAAAKWRSRATTARTAARRNVRPVLAIRADEGSRGYWPARFRRARPRAAGASRSVPDEAGPPTSSSSRSPRSQAASFARGHAAPLSLYGGEARRGGTWSRRTIRPCDPAHRRWTNIDQRSPALRAGGAMNNDTRLRIAGRRGLRRLVASSVRSRDIARYFKAP